jgi:hypothetical protein
MTRIEMLTKNIDPRNLSELVDQYVFGRKNTRLRRIARAVFRGQTRYLKLAIAIRILRALLRKLPKDKQYMFYFDYLALHDVPEILALAIDICQRRSLTLTTGDLEPERYRIETKEPVL